MLWVKSRKVQVKLLAGGVRILPFLAVFMVSGHKNEDESTRVSCAGVHLVAAVLSKRDVASILAN